MVGISSLILSIKCSPFVPIRPYRDLPRSREFLSDPSLSTNTFSLSPLRTQEPAGLGREIDCHLLLLATRSVNR
jgi:hypothetical protein